MAVSTKRLSVDESLRDSVDSLLSVKTEQFGDNGSRSDFDEDDVVETDAVERIEQSQSTLNLVCFDHRLEDVLHREVLSGACKVIRNSENGSQIVRRVSPFCGKETVVEVEPSDLCADVECTTDGVELVVGSGNSSAVGDDSTGHDGSKELRARLETQTFESTANSVYET